MRRIYAALAVLLAAGCGGQTTDTCVMKVDIEDVLTVQTGVIKVVHSQLGTKAGKCSGILKAPAEWASSDPTVLQLVSANDTTATVKGLKVGTVYLQTWLRLSPSIRDSVQVAVTAPRDTL